MIEDVERFKAELRSYALRDGEVFEQRHIGVEEAGSGKGIASAAKFRDLRPLEWTRSSRWWPCGHRSEEGNTGL